MFIRTIFAYIIALLILGLKNAADTAPLETEVLGLSAASSVKNLGDNSFLNFKNLFAANGDVEIENIIFSIDEDMNEKGAATVYFVVCYDPILLDALKTDTASQFKNRIEDYINDYPDKIVVLKWSIPAKERLSHEINVGQYYEKKIMSPLGGFIFVTYSTPGNHRYRIPGSWTKMKICLHRKDCKLEQIK